MDKVRIGILGTSDIARRRFLPAIKKSDFYEFGGVALSTDEERNRFVTSEFGIDKKIKREALVDSILEEYGGIRYRSYEELILSDDIDAVYIPLPPVLHFPWALRCLEEGKHLLMEKPFTVNAEKTNEIIKMAKKKNLAVHENYAFIYHPQVDKVKEILDEKRIGDIRMMDARFCFPMRNKDDFRYQKKLGGGALLDCGGYLIKCAGLFLEDYDICYARQGFLNEFDVDFFGFAVLQDAFEKRMNIEYGMDNAYACSLCIWGNKGKIETHRFFTPPPEMKPIINLEYSDGMKETITIPMEDTFLKSLNVFYECIHNKKRRERNYEEIKIQGERVEKLKKVWS